MSLSQVVLGTGADLHPPLYYFILYHWQPCSVLQRLRCGCYRICSVCSRYTLFICRAVCCFKEEVVPVRNLHTILQEIYTSLLEIYGGGLSRYWEMHTSQ